MNKKDDKKYRLLAVITKHVGANRAISMERLYTEIYGEEPSNLINSTRSIRKLIELTRREGIPICSLRKKNFHGYYLAGAGSELEEYCKRLRKEALKKLAMEARLRKITLPQLINELQLNL